MVPASQLPLVSMIMPVRNESAYIARSLGAVLAQDYPHHLLEVLIADGNSSDDTCLKIAQLSRCFPDSRIEVIPNPEQYVPTGFNRALVQARGEVVVLLGGHAEISPDYVSRCVHLLQETSAACVGGAMETVAEGWVGEAIAVGMASRFGVGNVAFRTRPDQVMEVDTAVFGAYRREVFHKIGGLDEEMIRNQDDEINYRLRASGDKILFSPAIRARYHSRGSFSSLWRQYFQYGLWKVRVLQKHPRQMSLRQFAPPALVVALLVSVFLAFWPGLRPVSSIIPFLYLLANLLASVYIAFKQGWKFLPLLPFVFAALHLSYGSGFLIGLSKFWNRWGDKTVKLSLGSGEAGG